MRPTSIGINPSKASVRRLAKAKGHGDLHRPHPTFVNIGERDAQLLDELVLITLPAGPGGPLRRAPRPVLAPRATHLSPDLLRR
jgi:hypothetical protein